LILNGSVIDAHFKELRHFVHCGNLKQRQTSKSCEQKFKKPDIDIVYNYINLNNMMLTFYRKLNCTKIITFDFKSLQKALNIIL